MTKRLIDYWVIPPEADAEFTACMEEVLETYAQPYNPLHPVVCMDEQPVQLIKETRSPLQPLSPTRSGLITNMSVMAPPVFSCLLNHWRVIAR